MPTHSEYHSFKEAFTAGGHLAECFGYKTSIEWKILENSCLFHCRKTHGFRWYIHLQIEVGARHTRRILGAGTQSKTLCQFNTWTVINQCHQYISKLFWACQQQNRINYTRRMLGVRTNILITLEEERYCEKLK